MGKKFYSFSICEGKISYGKSCMVERCSRWIKIKEAYDVSHRHPLYDYCTDANGYHPYQDQFDPSKGTYLYYFEHGGRKYALDQFIRYGSAFSPIIYGIRDPKTGEEEYLSGYDADGDIYHPYQIELDEYCEKVRLYRDVKISSTDYPNLQELLINQKVS